MRETHCSSIVQQLHDYSHNLELERAQGDEITTINFFAGTERLELVHSRRVGGHKFSNMDLFDSLPHFASRGVWARKNIRLISSCNTASIILLYD